MIEIALYQPDIAPNAATIARLCACFGLPMTIIEPAGFAYTDSSFRRAGMDYLQNMDLRRADSWNKFRENNAHRRLILLSTKASESHTNFKFLADDILILGRESAGVPPEVHEAIANRIRIPMKPGMRSLNVAVSAAIVASEALRQLNYFA